LARLGPDTPGTPGGESGQGGQAYWLAYLPPSIGTLLNSNGESIKTIQELLRHANTQITLEIYVQGDQETKRNALKGMSEIFVVPSLKKAS
jgi:hypothetical protein